MDSISDLRRARPADDDEPDLGREEVHRRAVEGSGLIGVQSVVIRAFGLLGNIVLARLLTPEDFGLVAFGLVLLTFGTYLAEAGMGAALVRRPEAPSRAELEAMLGFSLVVASVIAGTVAAIGFSLGGVGSLAGAMAVSLPVVAFRLPGAITLERRMQFRPLVRVELLEAAAYYGWAIAAVALGWGVWGLATAQITRAVVGTCVMARTAPVGLLRPRFELTRVRGLLRFGVQFQALGVLNMVRDHGLNVGTAAIAGVGVLGVWTLANRVLQIAGWLFGTMWRVSFTTMARLVAGGEDPQPVIEKAVSYSAIVTGAILTGVAASSSLAVPVVFGERWSEAASIVLWSSIGFLIAGPVSVATTGFLFAINDARTPLLGVALHTVAFFVVTFPLLRPLGPVALGLGQVASAITEAVVLGRATRRRVPVRIFSQQAPSFLLAIAAIGTGALAATRLPVTLLGAVTAAALAEAVFLAGLFVIAPQPLGQVIAMSRRAVVATVRPGAP